MSTIKIVQANIAELPVDFVVNAANKDLRAGSGVCGDIFAAAGMEQLQEACKKIGGCEVGRAVMTPGFDLPARYIIHAVGPHWNGGTHGEEEQLYCCYQTAMEFARMYGGHSIAFPVISSGVFGYPKEEAWKVAIRSVQDFLRWNNTYDIDVTFAVNSSSSLELGMQILADSETVPSCEKKHVRLYTVDELLDIPKGKANFIAEFADRKLATNYISYMMGKKRFANKDIAVEEVMVKEGISEYKVVTVEARTGEELNMLTRDW